jgi:hypothetical protein
VKLIDGEVLSESRRNKKDEVKVEAKNEDCKQTSK